VTRVGRLGDRCVLGVIVAFALAACQGQIPTTTPAATPTTTATETPTVSVHASAVGPLVSATPSVPPPYASSTPASSGSATTATLLDSLVVAPEHHGDYDRDLFHTWIDADGDGCNTRYEVLIAEAVVAPTIEGSCDLVGGVWHSAFDDVDLHGAAEVQVDHLVALAEAWYSGAYAWSPERREAFANDLGTPLELNGVSGQVNESKGSYDPAKWLPPALEAVCPYVDAWIATKVRWQLTIDIEERDALRREVDTCGAMPSP
jgi:hypothetical protein